MAEMVYEGPDDVLVVGTLEMSRGVPVDLPSTLAKIAAGFPGVRPAEPRRASRGAAEGTGAAEG